MPLAVLAWALSYSFSSNAQVNTGPASGQTGDIIILGNGWTGTVSPCTQNVDCWHGSTDNGDIHMAPQTNHGVTYYWSGTQQTLTNTIAIQTALQAAGIQIDGFDYEWVFKNANANYYANQPGGGGVDPFEIVVNIYDSNGNLYKSYTYDYGNQFYGWNTQTGTELFNAIGLDPTYFGNVVVEVTAQDIGQTPGYYGPEFRADQSGLYVNYSADPCYNNQIYDPACPGYAQALYNQQCTANPLYDPGCPGYAQAFFTQQCNANPLSDPACPGYSNAYYNQQCTLNPLYDAGCTGYQAALSTCNSNYHLNDSLCPDYTQNTRNCSTNALYDSNCSGYATAYNTCTANYHLNDSMCPDYANNLTACTINPLIDTNCSGYATAYFNQQCSLNPLYDSACKGYGNAVFSQQCNANPKSDPQCPDYYIAMCEDDPLYDMGCVGYDVAYFNQQCSLDAQYDQSCPGYVDLSGNDDVVSILDPVVDDVVNTETNISTGEPEFYQAEIPQTETTFVQDDIEVEIEDVEVENSQQVLEEDIEAEIAELESMDGEEVMEDDIESELAKLENASEESSGGGPLDARQGGANQEDDIEKELAELEKAKPIGDQPRPGKAMPKPDPVESRRDKMRLLIAMKAIEAVKELEAAVTLEQQMDIQRRLLALISFVPDFKNYNEEEIQDLANFYPPKPTVDHAFARWFLNDPKFSMMTDLQYR